MGRSIRSFKNCELPTKLIALPTLVSKTNPKPLIDAHLTLNDCQTVAESLRKATAQLLPSRTYSPRLDAEVLLRYVLGIDRTTLFSRLQDPVDASAQTEFDRLVEKR